MNSLLSIVVSVYNEEEILAEFHKEILDVISALAVRIELIFVDDGSTDSSLFLLKNWKDSLDFDVKIISLSRNYGHESAMICGIDHAKGDIIICMDSDLQHPPSHLNEMIENFKKGYEIVTMVRYNNYDGGVLRSYFSKQFYSIINKLSEYKLDKNASDFFLISKSVADILRNDFRERNRFLRGFIQIVGFSKTSLKYNVPPRLKGRSKYSFPKLLKLSVNAIISFSKFPLYLGIYIGSIFAFFSVLLGVYTVGQYVWGDSPPSGYTTIVLFLSLSFSVLFVLIGIIGVYIGYIFEENKGRPIYIVRDII